MTCWASPGPGVAGNGFSAKNDCQFRGRHSNPSPGDPFRGPFSFLKVTPNDGKRSCLCVLFCGRFRRSRNACWPNLAPWGPHKARTIPTICFWDILGERLTDPRFADPWLVIFCFVFWFSGRSHVSASQQKKFHYPGIGQRGIGSPPT